MQNSNFGYQPNYNPEQIKQAYQQHIYFKNKRSNELKEIFISGLAIGGTMVISLFMQVFSVLFLQIGANINLLEASSRLQNAFNIIAVDILSLVLPYFLLSLVLKRNYQGDLVPRKKLGFRRSFAWICVGMACCAGANYFTSYVIMFFRTFGYKLTQTQYKDPSSIVDCIVLVFSTALAPALCEEFAMRCSALGALRKYGKGFAVTAVSIIFGLIHGNVIQFIFAFLLGLVFGYITIATDSILPAMFIHGFNNAISVINDILIFATGSSKVSDYVGPAIYIMWLVLGVFGLIYLVSKKEIIPKRQHKIKEPYAPSFGLKLLCLLPGLTIPLLVLIFETTQSIVPV